MISGFRLSFAATGGILLLHRPFTAMLSIIGGRRWRTWFAVPLAVSVAAQVTTAPLIISAFGQISLIATAANMIVVPVMSAAVGVGLVSVVVGTVSFDLTTVFSAANWSLQESALWVAHHCAAPGWAAVDVTLPGISILATIFCGVLVTTEWVRSHRLAGYVVIAGLACANYSVWASIGDEDHLVVRVLDVGQGDGILISFPKGKNILVDGGIAGYGQDAGERVVLPVLRHLGIRKLDAVIASHPHADHVGGLVTVLDRVEVLNYLDSGQYYHTSTARRIRQLITDHGIRHHVVTAGDSIVGFGEAELIVLHPRDSFVSLDGEAPDGLNNGSVVIKVGYRGQSILMTGDIEHETDDALLAWGNRLQSTILKAAHHGSRTSSSEAFLNAVLPEWVAISCGIDNKFRHPSPEVLLRYEERGIVPARTDREGCVTYRIGPDGVKVSGFLPKTKRKTANPRWADRL
jgi:competence protein ComEC